MVYGMVTRPWQRTHMDLAGPFVASKGFKYILVIKDFLTKYCVLFPVKSKEAEEIYNCLHKCIINYGPAEKLITDQGTEFNNKIMEYITKLLGIRKKYTTAYNPQADGLAENMMRTIKDMLATCVSTAQDDWSEYVEIIQLLYNTTVSSATDRTPFSLLYGRECAMYDMEKLQEVAQQQDVVQISERLEDFSKYMTKMWDVVALKCFNNQLRASKLPEYRLEYQPYKVGDRVFYLIVPKRTYITEEAVYKLNVKLSHRFAGPYEVIRVINPVTYVIRNIQKNKEITTHASRLKRA